MRYIRYSVLGVIGICLITVAIANRDSLTVRLLPKELSGLFGFSWQVTLPAFVILLAAVIVGVLIGFVWEWVREHRYRAEAAVNRKERARLEQEVKKVAPKDNSGDDVLAILDGKQA